MALGPVHLQFALALEDGHPPRFVVDVPADSVFETGFELDRGCPAQLGFDLVRVDEVAPIVVRSVSDVLDSVDD